MKVLTSHKMFADEFVLHLHLIFLWNLFAYICTLLYNFLFWKIQWRAVQKTICNNSGYDVTSTFDHTHNTIWLYSFYDTVYLVYGNINSTWLMKNHETATSKICTSICYIEGPDLKDTFIQVKLLLFLHYRNTVCVYVSLLCMCVYEVIGRSLHI